MPALTPVQESFIRIINRRLASRPFTRFTSAPTTSYDSNYQQIVYDIFGPGFWSLAVHLRNIDVEYFSRIKNNRAVPSNYLLEILSILSQAQIQVPRNKIDELLQLLENCHDQSGVVAKIKGVLEVCSSARLLTPENYWPAIMLTRNSCENDANSCFVPEALNQLKNVGLLNEDTMNRVLTAYQNAGTYANVNHIRLIFQLLHTGIQPSGTPRASAAERLDPARYLQLLPVLFSHGQALARSLNRIAYNPASTRRNYEEAISLYITSPATAEAIIESRYRVTVSMLPSYNGDIYRTPLAPMPIDITAKAAASKGSPMAAYSPAVEYSPRYTSSSPSSHSLFAALPAAASTPAPTNAEPSIIRAPSPTSRT